jgi:hypothetical protein
MSLKKLLGLGSSSLIVVAVGGVARGQNFNSAIDYTANFDPEMTAAGDLDNDGDIDLAVTSDAPDKVSIYLNNSDGTFAAPIDVMLPVSSNPHGVAIGDWNGNGRMDLAVTLEDLNQVQIIDNPPTGPFTLGATYQVGASPVHITTGRLVASSPDFALITTNRDGDSVSILLPAAGGNFATAVDVTVGSGPSAAAAEDLDEDGDIDLVVASTESNQLTILLNDGLGTMSAGPTLSMGSIEPTGVVIVDLDDDKDNDIVCCGSDGASQNFASVWLQTSPGVFTGPTDYSTNGSEPSSIVAGDFDLDTDLDIAVTDAISNDVSVLSNNGDGTLASPLLFGVDQRPLQLVAADLDGNGSQDLVSTNQAGDSVTVLINVEHSGFSDLDNGLGGTFGIPLLVGQGTLLPNSPAELDVSGGLPNAAGFLIIGLTRIDGGFAGGIMVPSPDFIIPIVLDAAGNVELEGTWPSGATTGDDFYFQVWLLDPLAKRGLSATNALVGIAR